MNEQQLLPIGSHPLLAVCHGAISGSVAGPVACVTLRGSAFAPSLRTVRC